MSIHSHHARPAGTPSTTSLVDSKSAAPRLQPGPALPVRPAREQQAELPAWPRAVVLLVPSAAAAAAAVAAVADAGDAAGPAAMQGRAPQLARSPAFCLDTPASANDRIPDIVAALQMPPPDFGVLSSGESTPQPEPMTPGPDRT